ncbi:DUF262 domain-containing protein [Cellulomonas hominis]
MSRIESYASMFSVDVARGPAVDRIEIPLIQRDYAQGRRAEKVDGIREDFLDVLHGAVSGTTAPVSLDFVYGEQVGGTLRPLDGQQRLTTLFLLHWYIAARSGHLEPGASWTRLSYATRPSAERFCERLAAAVPPEPVAAMSNWVKDQPWYLFVWRHDPTIQSMLVMLDAIHERFGQVDPHLAWQRLADSQSPAISFHLLPLPDMGSAEDLYIKMNSRGKPLTDFENFKAHFERTIEWSPRAHEFALKADGAWSDILWRFRGDDHIIDDEFMRYLEFVTEVCEWADPTLTSGAGGLALSGRAEQVFGSANPNREQHLAFLLDAFDVWQGREIDATFAGLFRPPATDPNTGPDTVPIYFRSMGRSVNLFEVCCRLYGDTTGGGARVFSFGQTLLLLATVLHLIHDSEDFPRRVRVLRNLIEGSAFEMRADRMPRLVADARGLILSGALPERGSSFSLGQIDDETAKRNFLAEHPSLAPVLFRLEDHDLLRGSLGAFELDPPRLASRTDAFETIMNAPDLWGEITGTLLSVGEYQRPRGRDAQSTRSFQFATRSEKHRDVWRTLLTGAPRDDLAATARVLGDFLDEVAAAGSPLAQTLATMQQRWLSEREANGLFDWRYYFVKYPSMREGASGIYFAEGGRLGYSLCNLKGGRTQVNSWYRDPYLLTIWEELGAPDSIEDPWFLGYEWSPRWLRLVASGTGVRCTTAGFELTAPTADHALDALDAVRSELGIGPDLILPILQTTIDDRLVDSHDRIALGVDLVRRLIESGL